MSSLKLKHIYKVYPNGMKAVNDFNIDIKDKEFIVFVGPSGCGKSTTLRMIAGLEDITAGELYIDSKLVNNVEPKNRDIAFVFQNYALYPHMTVYENMAFGLKCHKVPYETKDRKGNTVIKYKKLPKEEINQKILDAAKILDIVPYLDKKPIEMSGGQRQRVALGRALVRNPKVFLLDEPLSNLDAKLRTQMRTEITKLHKKIGTTFIYVTHDQTEAMTMGSRIVVMKNGFVQQIDTPLNLYNNPANKFVAGFIGTPQMNFYKCRLSKNGEEVAVKLSEDLSFNIPYSEVKKINSSYLNENKDLYLGCRPEHINIGTGIQATINVIERLGTETILYCTLPNNQQITIRKSSNLNVESEQVINISFDSNHLKFFDSETEENLIKNIPDKNNIEIIYHEEGTEIFGQKVKLPKALSSKLIEGETYTLEIPIDAFIKGNILKLDFIGSEKIEEDILKEFTFNGYSYYLKTNEEDSLHYNLDFKKITILKNNEIVISSLPQTIEFDSKILRNKDGYFYEIEGYISPAQISKVAKVAAADGTNCHKLTYSFSFPINSISFDSEGISFKVKEYLDYGRLYAKLIINDKEFIVPCDSKLNEKERLNLNYDKLVIISKVNNIIISD